MVQTWAYNQLIKIHQYHPELVEHGIRELLAHQHELRLQAGTEYFLAVVSAEPHSHSELARKELIFEIEG